MVLRYQQYISNMDTNTKRQKTPVRHFPENVLSTMIQATENCAVGWIVIDVIFSGKMS